MNNTELYYKNLLTKYKKLMVFDFSTYERMDMVENIISSTNDDRRPVIVVTRYSTVLYDKMKNDRLIIMNPKYSDIEALKGEDNRGEILIFRGGERDPEHTEFLPNLELAMLANNIMLRQGERPLIVIEPFEEFYISHNDGEIYDSFKEIIIDEISAYQNLVLISQTVSPYDKNYAETQDFGSIILTADAMVFTKDYLSNYYTGPLQDVIWTIQDTLKNSPDDLNDLVEEFRRIYKDEERLQQGLVFDFKLQTIEDFKGMPA